MIINNNKLNSLPQQVEENKNNIMLLASYLKEAYKSSLPLNVSDVSVAISVTNATADTTDGWLLDSIGKLFKINGGDGTNLLIEYYTSFRGEQGTHGYNIHYSSYDYVNGSYTYPYSSLNSVGDIRQNDIIVFKNGYIATLYSYDIPTTFTIYDNNIIQLDIQMNVKSTNIYISSSQATYDSGTYSFLIPITAIRKLDGSSFSVDDFDENADNLIYYIDMSSMNPQDVKLKAIYNFRGIDTISTPNNAICNIEMLVGGGKQLYQHNITLFGTASNTLKIQLLSEDNTSFNFTKLKNWLIDKGFETSGADTQYYYKTSGHSSNNTIYDGIAYDNVNNTFRLWYGASCITYTFNDSDFIDDTII